jgi:phosphonate transport system substrate-binding protein
LPSGRVALLVGLFTAVSFAPPVRGEELRLGVLPRLPAPELTVMFTPLADHLSRATGRKVRLVIAPDFDAFARQVRGGELDLAFSNPLVYVQLARQVELVPLALAKEQKGGRRFRGVILARKDSGFRGVASLKGKRLVFVDESSLGGYLAQALLLKRHGFDVRRDFTLLPFAGTHDAVAMAVSAGAADAGGIREDDLAKLAGKVDLSRLEVVAFTDYFPGWPVFATSRVDAGTRDALRRALLGLKPGAPPLDAARLEALGPVADKDYDRLREAARAVGAF